MKYYVAHWDYTQVVVTTICPVLPSATAIKIFDPLMV